MLVIPRTLLGHNATSNYQRRRTHPDPFFLRTDKLIGELQGWNLTPGRWGVLGSRFSRKRWVGEESFLKMKGGERYEMKSILNPQETRALFQG